MSAAHTPGPWEVRACNGRPDEGPALFVETADRRPLMRGDFCRTEADASLIAAAPELLETLQEAYTVLARFAGPSTNPALDRMRAAIAKANAL